LTLLAVFTERLLDLAIKFLGQAIDVTLCLPEGASFIAEHTLRRPLDALTQLLDALVRIAHRVRRFALDADVEQLPRHVKRLVNPLLVCFADRIVQRLCEPWFRLLSLFDRLLHLVEQAIEVLALLREAGTGLRALARVAEAAPLFLISLIHLVGQLLLALVEIAGRVAHLCHFLAKTVGRLLSELVANVVQFASGPRAFGQGFGHLPFFQRFARLLHARAAFLKLFLRILILLLVFRLLDAAD
jgi:hypothetical protein